MIKVKKDKMRSVRVSSEHIELLDQLDITFQELVDNALKYIEYSEKEKWREILKKSTEE